MPPQLLDLSCNNSGLVVLTSQAKRSEMVMFYGLSHLAVFVCERRVLASLSTGLGLPL
jgi:hypothetical protein